MMAPGADREFSRKAVMKSHHHLQPRALLRSAALGVFMLTLTGYAALGSTQGLEGVSGPYFGDAVSVAEYGALIGSPGGAGGKSPGLVYVFERASDGWTQRAALSAEAGKPGNEFGSAVAFAETIALVGAWGTDGVAPVSGSAYVFERGPTGWGQTAVLINPDAGERHILGKSVALDRSTAVVGAPGVNRRLRSDTSKSAPAWSGAVYVWSRAETGWRYQARITPDSQPLPSGPAAQPRPYHLWADFGSKVAIHADILVVGARAGAVNLLDGSTTPGTVYVFRRVTGTWKQEAKLEQQKEFFGSSIAVSNGTVAVTSSGSVFVFAHADGDWRLQARVEPHVPGEDSGFKYSGPVSIDGNLMVVGAPRYKKRKGAAFVFERVGSDWKQAAMITAEDAQSDSLSGRSVGDQFGGSVSIHGADVVVGASFHDSEGPNYGAAYVFRREGSRWLQTSKLVARIPAGYPTGAKGR